MICGILVLKTHVLHNEIKDLVRAVFVKSGILFKNGVDSSEKLVVTLGNADSILFFSGAVGFTVRACIVKGQTNETFVLFGNELSGELVDDNYVDALSLGDSVSSKLSVVKVDHYGIGAVKNTVITVIVISGSVDLTVGIDSTGSIGLNTNLKACKSIPKNVFAVNGRDGIVAFSPDNVLNGSIIRNGEVYLFLYGFGDVEFMVDEWGASTGGYDGIDKNPAYEFRENEKYAAYYARMLTLFDELNLPIEQMMICLSGQHDLKVDFGGHRNFFSKSFYPKPIYNAHVLANKLGDEKLHYYTERDHDEYVSVLPSS